jgi:hypothetical protein
MPSVIMLSVIIPNVAAASLQTTLAFKKNNLGISKLKKYSYENLAILLKGVLSTKSYYSRVFIALSVKRPNPVIEGQSFHLTQTF